MGKQVRVWLASIYLVALITPTVWALSQGGRALPWWGAAGFALLVLWLVRRPGWLTFSLRLVIAVVPVLGTLALVAGRHGRLARAAPMALITLGVWLSLHALAPRHATHPDGSVEVRPPRTPLQRQRLRAALVKVGLSIGAATAVTQLAGRFQFLPVFILMVFWAIGSVAANGAALRAEGRFAAAARWDTRLAHLLLPRAKAIHLYNGARSWLDAEDLMRAESAALKSLAISQKRSFSALADGACATLAAVDLLRGDPTAALVHLDACSASSAGGRLRAEVHDRLGSPTLAEEGIAAAGDAGLHEGTFDHGGLSWHHDRGHVAGARLFVALHSWRRGHPYADQVLREAAAATSPLWQGYVTRLMEDAAVRAEG